ncbi:MAG: DUF1648 domain-containing protein [Planctomycetota bacterium]
MNRLALFVLLALMLLFGAQAAYYYPQMPERMATHFDFSGQADGYMSRSALIWVTAFTALMSGGMMFGIALLLKRLPDSLINMPNKDYWLVPARRDESLDAMTGSLLWIGSATMGLMLVVFQSIYRANLDGSNAVGWSAMVLLGVYLLIVLAIAVRMMRRFRMPSGSKA